MYYFPDLRYEVFQILFNRNRLPWPWLMRRYLCQNEATAVGYISGIDRNTLLNVRHFRQYRKIIDIDSIVTEMEYFITEIVKCYSMSISQRSVRFKKKRTIELRNVLSSPATCCGHRVVPPPPGWVILPTWIRISWAAISWLAPGQDTPTRPPLLSLAPPPPDLSPQTPRWIHHLAPRLPLTGRPATGLSPDWPTTTLYPGNMSYTTFSVLK